MHPTMTPRAMPPGYPMQTPLMMPQMSHLRPGTQGPPVKPLLPFQNTYAQRLKDGPHSESATSSAVSTLLLPPSGILTIGKRKRSQRVETVNLDDELGSVSNSDQEIDRDDPKDMDAEKMDDRLKVIGRQLHHDAQNTSSSVRVKQQRRIRRTRHDYLLPFYRDLAASVTESLVPIRLELEIDGMKLRDAFMWNLKERFLTPKKFAEFMCEDLDVPASMYASVIEEAMKVQIAEQMALMANEVPFDNDTRVVINLDILFNQYHLVDRFEWDLSSPLTPEQFALQLSKDLGLGSEFPPLVSHAIHEQLSKVKNVVAAVSHSAAANNAVVEDVDEANLILGMLRESTRPLEVGLRQGREHDVEEWGPIVEEMSREAVDKYTTEKEKEKGRRQRNNRVGMQRRRSGFFIDFSAGFMSPGNLGVDEETWANPEEKSVWRCVQRKTNHPPTYWPQWSQIALQRVW
ncbi:Chromatin structure remodeling complex protein sfh1 [Podochytrium sp. JEL0797]|nr:Chromatin structure remodeling complex protein sfh1 [Podochytrium sp. JEL0797]